MMAKGKPTGATGTLCLDLATVVGWAFGVPGGAIEFGEKSFIDAAGNAAMGHAFWCWLDMQLVQRQPARVVFESPILHARKTSVATARRLMGMAFVTEIISSVWNSVEVLEEDSGTVTKWLTGQARWPAPTMTGSAAQRREASRQLKKRKVMEACAARGFYTKTDNEADAVALFLYVETHLDKVLRMAA